MVKIQYDIFIPEKGSVNYQKTTYDWKHKNISQFLSPFETIEIHVTENLKCTNREVNISAVEFLCDMGKALEDHNLVATHAKWTLNMITKEPIGPVGIKIKDKKMLAVIREFFTGKKYETDASPVGSQSSYDEEVENGESADFPILISDEDDDISDTKKQKIEID
jgi:hypothetical protein